MWINHTHMHTSIFTCSFLRIMCIITSVYTYMYQSWYIGSYLQIHILINHTYIHTSSTSISLQHHTWQQPSPTKCNWHTHTNKKHKFLCNTTHDTSPHQPSVTYTHTHKQSIPPICVRIKYICPQRHILQFWRVNGYTRTSITEYWWSQEIVKPTLNRD